MKVVVTGGTGAFGMAVCRQLARAGADPVAFARHEPAVLPAGVRFLAGDIRDETAVDRAVSGCDAVVHLAWFMGVGAPPADVAAVNIGGTTNLLNAMERSGCRRLVFTSSTTSYGTSEHHPEPFREDEPQRPSPTFVYADHKRRAEQLIAGSDLDAVVARVTVQLGRGVDNGPAQAYAGPALLDVGGRSVVQVVHQDDVGRFLELAVLGSMVGTVNLAAPGSVSMRRAGQLLGRRVVTVPLGASMRIGAALSRLGVQGIDEEVARVLAYWPVADTTKLAGTWGFEPVWYQEDILRDQARSASRSTYIAPNTSRLPRRRRLPWAATAPPDPSVLRPDAAWRHAAPEGVRGEFDSRVDPAFPMYSGSNLHEAFPGPMTPLSLDLALHGMGATIDGLVTLFGFRGGPADVMRLGIGSFGHRVYANVSAARLMADVVPGATVDDVDRMYLGIERPRAPKKRLGVKEGAAAGRLAARIAPRLVGYRAEVDRLDAEARDLAAVEPAALGHPALLSHLSLLHDMVCQAWNTSSTGNFLLSGVASALDGAAGSESAGATTLRGVRALADVLRRTPETHPEFVRAFEALLAECGHRGPGETELDNEVFADRPDLLLDVIRRAASAPDGGDGTPRPAAMSGRWSPGAWLARRLIEDKERARDAGVRLIHAFRRSARERGRRLAGQGLLSDASDVVYLTYDELFARTPPSPAVIDGRRAERRRLASLRMPLTFDGWWEPVDDRAPPVSSGDVLSGVGAVAGRYEGVVRVMVEATDDIEPGEVLVARTTDVGWTPYFALAGAVVTDVGGAASHAAIVAREHGIPSVVGVDDATRRLATGTRVLVDGATGTVEVLATP